MKIASQDHLGISVFHGEEHIAGGYNETLWHSPNLQRQLTPMLPNNVPPTSLVEELVFSIVEMLLEELLCLINHLICDHNPHQMLLQDILQPKEEHFFEFSSPAFKIGEDTLHT